MPRRKSKLDEPFWLLAIKSLLQEGPLPDYKRLQYAAHIYSDDTARRVYKDVGIAIKSALGDLSCANPPRRGNKFREDIYTDSEKKKMRNSTKLYVEFRDLDYNDYVAVIICSQSCYNNVWEIHDSRFTVGRKKNSADRIEDVLREPLLEMIDDYSDSLSRDIVIPLGDNSNSHGTTLETILKEAGCTNIQGFWDEAQKSNIGHQRTITGRMITIDAAFDNLEADILKSKIFPKGTRKKPNSKNDVYVKFCVLKHMLKLGPPGIAMIGRADRRTRTGQKMIDEVITQLKRSKIIQEQ